MLFRDSCKGVEGNGGYAPNDAVAAFNSLLDNVGSSNWYTAAEGILDSSSSCSPTPASVFNGYDNHQVSNYFMPQNPIPPNSNPFELGFESWPFETGLDNEIRALNSFGGQTELGNFNLSPNSCEFAVQLSQGRFEIGGLGLGYGEGSIPTPPPLLINRSQPTLFQKRSGLQMNIENINVSNSVNFMEGNDVLNGGRKRKSDVVDNLSYCDDDDDGDDHDDDLEGQTVRIGGSNRPMEGSGKNGDSSSPGNSAVTGDGGRGKKKGHPAKNLLAERRRRKKLNDRLYMLRSVVPKISKMDRASILGDAIEYVKELAQKISDLQTELDLPPSYFHPGTSNASGLPALIKEEHSPRTGSQSSAIVQPARVEVRVKDGGVVNIHMFCGLRPRLLLSTMQTIEGLGLDIEHAIVSCFNGFTMDVFRAEKCNEGEELKGEEIKAALLETAGYHGII